MNDDAEGGPRSARGPAAARPPHGGNDDLTARIRAMGQVEVFDALRALGFASLAHGDMNVRAIAAVLVRLTSELRLDDFPREIGLVRAGGYENSGKAVAIRWRNDMLRRLRRTMFGGLRTQAAAREIQKRYSAYHRFRANRDARRGYCDGDEADQIFFRMRAFRVRLPESAVQMLRILK